MERKKRDLGYPSVRFKSFVVFGLCPLFAGCGIFDLNYEPHPTERIAALRWSENASSIVALREIPFDSASSTYWKYYVEKYDRQGSLLSSLQTNIGSAFPYHSQHIYSIAFTSDCQHLIFSDESELIIANIKDSTFHTFLPWPGSAIISPSGHIILSDTDNGSGVDGRDIWYQLTWIDSGNIRTIRQWQTHGDQSSPDILTDNMFCLPENLNGSDFFSVYDTSLTLLYREPMPPHGMRGIGYVPSLNSILVARNWNSPELDGKVMLIDLKTGQSKYVLDWPGDMNCMYDGYHVVYAWAAVKIRNLLTGNEKNIASESPTIALFSPDGQYVCYIPLNAATVRSVAVGSLP